MTAVVAEANEAREAMPPAATASPPTAGAPGAPAPDQAKNLPEAIGLEGALRQIAEATHAWGVQRDSAEGAFVSAFMGAVSAVALIVENARSDIQHLLDQQREAGKDELARIRELTKAAGLALSQARQAGLSYEVEQAGLVLKMVDRTLPLFAEKLQGALVLREKQLNVAVQRRRYAVVGLVTLALVGGGYGLRAWQDSGAVGALGDCLAHPVLIGGRTFCDVTTLAGAR